MKKMVFITAGMAWLAWPGSIRALSLGCELPGYEAEQHYPPVDEECRRWCDLYSFRKGQTDKCPSGWYEAWYELTGNDCLDGWVWECI